MERLAETKFTPQWASCSASANEHFLPVQEIRVSGFDDPAPIDFDQFGSFAIFCSPVYRSLTLCLPRPASHLHHGDSHHLPMVRWLSRASLGGCGLTRSWPSGPGLSRSRPAFWRWVSPASGRMMAPSRCFFPWANPRRIWTPQRLRRQ